MKIEKIIVIFFSPVGKTALVATTVGEALGKLLQIPVEHDDFTLPQNRKHIREFGPRDLVVFAVPVYAGRIPNKMLPFVQNYFKGQRTWVVPMVTYGNRNFDNGLKELCFELDKNGFLSIGAAAVVVEHSFSQLLATKRPNGLDVKALETFAKAISEKVVGVSLQRKQGTMMEDFCPLDRKRLFLDIDAIPGQWPLEKYYTPLGVDGQPAVFLKAKPKTDGTKCVSCGLCAKVCPMGSVSAEDVICVGGICIKCQACVKKCPQQAKYFDDVAFLSHVKMLEENYERKAESQFFVGV